MRVCVIGAGLSGLTAAYRLKQNDIEVKVFEAESQVGGRVQTIKKGDYLIDTGANTLFEGYDDYLALLVELGLSKDLVRSAGSVANIREGKLHQFDMTRIVSAALGTKLISFSSKLRMTLLLWDIFRLRSSLDYRNLSKAADFDGESVSDYCRRRLNKEIHDYIAEPMIRGLVVTTAEQVSMLELLSGFNNLFNGGFMSLKGGLSRFGQALAAQLDVQLDCPVKRVASTDDGVELILEDASEEEQVAQFDACVLAVPIHHAYRICPEYAELLKPLHEAQGYSSSIVVAIGTDPAPDCRDFVVQVPVAEFPEFALIMTDHTKAPDRAPEGHGLLSVLWQDDASRAAWDKTDEEIAEITLAQLERIWPGLKATVDMTNVERWNEVVPYTRPGCFKLQRELKQQLGADKRIQLAGDYLSTGGQNIAVVYGNRAADNIMQLRPAGDSECAQEGEGDGTGGRT